MQYSPSPEEEADAVIQGRLGKGPAFAFTVPPDGEPVLVLSESDSGAVGKEVLLACAALSDGDECQLADGTVVHRTGTSRWCPLGYAWLPAAKQVLLAPGHDARWARPKFDARIDIAYAKGKTSLVVQDPSHDALLCETVFPGLANPELGWEMLMGMGRGETSHFRFPDHAAGLRVSGPVRLEDFANPAESWETRTPAERLAIARALRKEGNAAVADGKLAHARRKYRRGLTFVDPPPQGKGKEAAVEKAGILLNLAAIDIREQRWESAINTCDRVMTEVDAKSAKARVRRAKANAELGRLQEAKEDIDKLQLQGLDGDVQVDVQHVLALVQKKKGAEDARMLPLAKAMLA